MTQKPNGKVFNGKQNLQNRRKR